MTRTPNWTYHSSRYHGKRHYMVYRDDHLAVELHVYTHDSPGWFSSGETKSYYIDGVEKRFRSEAAMLHMLDRIAERQVSERHSLIIHMSRSLNTYEDQPHSVLRRLSTRFRLRHRHST